MKSCYLILPAIFINQIWANPQTWFGTSPSCEGNWYECDPFDMKFVKLDGSGDGKTCWTGYKVLCELKSLQREQSIETNDKSSDQVTLSLVSYNIFERPWVATHDGQLERTCRIPRALAMQFPDADVIALQENFMFGCDSQMNFYKLFPFYGWPYVSDVVGSHSSVNGGARLISKYPLEDIHFHVYSASAIGTADYLAAKGFIYSKITKNGKSFHIIATHLQAQECGACDEARYAQAKEIRAFLDSRNISSDQPVILLGDLNVDNVRERNKVERMMNILNFDDLRNTGSLKYSYDGSLNDVVEPGEEPLWIDYVAVSKKHKMYDSANYSFAAVHLKADEYFSYCNTAPLSPYWIYQKSGLCRAVKTTENLSDHFPVHAKLTFKW